MLQTSEKVNIRVKEVHLSILSSSDADASPSFNKGASLMVPFIFVIARNACL